MSVDARRERFHVQRVAAAGLDDRLIAQAYRPDVVAAMASLRARGARPLASLLEGRLSQGSTPEYGGDGAPCLKTRNVAGGLVDETHVDRVSARFAASNAHRLIRPGTVLMNRSGAGSIGRVSLYLGGEDVFTNEELFRFRIASPHDAAFVTVFFGTSLGERVLERGVNGSTGQLKLALEHVEGVPVLAPHPLVQRYIGDKVRHAERLRVRAQARRRDLSALLSLTGLAKALCTPEGRASRIPPRELRPRLDAKYYGSRAMAVLRASARDSVPLASLVERINNGFEHREFVGEGTPYITVSEVSGGRLVVGRAPRIAANIRVPRMARIDSRCVLVVRTGSVGVAAKVFDADAGASISGHLIRLRCSSEAVAAVVAAFLNSEVGVLLQRRSAYGAVQPQLGQDELLALPIPRLLLGRAEAVLRALKAEDAALRGLELLMGTARLLVESLLAGTVPEARLVAVQQALEVGERGPERLLLGALARDSGTP